MNKIVRKMQSEHQKYGRVKTCKLLTSSVIKLHGIECKLLKQETESSTGATEQTRKDMIERHSSAIASVSKLREYDAIANTQRKMLLKENKSLRDRFNEDVLEARKLESTVTSISNMIYEFLQVLETQSAHVKDVHLAGKGTTMQVELTDEQLLLTVKRTQSHSFTMITLIMILSALLLTVDFFSP